MTSPSEKLPYGLLEGELDEFPLPDIPDMCSMPDIPAMLSMLLLVVAQPARSVALIVRAAKIPVALIWFFNLISLNGR